MKKNNRDYFTNMFMGAVNWKKVEENADAIEAIFARAEKRQKENDNIATSDYVAKSYRPSTRLAVSEH